jgi:hypothetical protein
MLGREQRHGARAAGAVDRELEDLGVTNGTPRWIACALSVLAPFVIRPNSKRMALLYLSWLLRLSQ